MEHLSGLLWTHSSISTSLTLGPYWWRQRSRWSLMREQWGGRTPWLTLLSHRDGDVSTKGVWLLPCTCSQSLCSVTKTEDCEGHCALMSLFAITLGTMHFGNRLCYWPHPQEGVTLSARVKPCCVPLEGFEIYNFQLTGTG